MKKQSAKNAHSGERHPKAVLSDHEVELMREMHEEYPPGHPRHVGYTALGRIFDVHRNSAQKICQYQRRARLTPR